MDHSRIQEQLAPYVLGALEQDERAAIELHLGECAQCRLLADELVATAAALPAALAAVSRLHPSPELKDRVLRAVQEPVANASGSGAQPRRTRGIDLGQWRAALAVAAAIALALSLAWGVRLSDALDQERALRQRIAAHFSQQQEIVLEVVDAEDGTRIILRSPDPDSRAYGKLFTRPDLPHVVAMAARLPLPPAGETYHLWLTSQGQTFLAGTLPVNDQGFGLLTFDADQNGPRYEAAELTLQAPGSDAPGGETVLAWSA